MLYLTYVTILMRVCVHLMSSLVWVSFGNPSYPPAYETKWSFVCDTWVALWPVVDTGVSYYLEGCVSQLMSMFRITSKVQFIVCPCSRIISSLLNTIFAWPMLDRYSSHINSIIIWREVPHHRLEKKYVICYSSRRDGFFPHRHLIHAC